MGDLFAKIWSDPVWSKVIAALIVSAFTALAIYFDWWKRFGSALSKAWRQSHQLSPKISLVNVNATPPDKPGLTYPVKCYVEMRNDSEHSIAVWLSDYRPNKIPAKKKLLNVLQVIFGTSWVPVAEADQVAVLPRQLFRMWIPIDENRYTADMVNKLRGEIGEVVFSVNDEDIIVPI